MSANRSEKKVGQMKSQMMLTPDAMEKISEEIGEIMSRIIPDETFQDLDPFTKQYIFISATSLAQAEAHLKLASLIQGRIARGREKKKCT